MLRIVICLLCLGSVLSAPPLESGEHPRFVDDMVSLMSIQKPVSLGFLDGTWFSKGIFWNDTSANTAAALGNVGLLAGGLYLLSFVGGGLFEPLRRMSSNSRLIDHRANHAEDHNYNHHDYNYRGHGHQEYRPINKHHRRRRPRPDLRPYRAYSSQVEERQLPPTPARRPFFSLPALRMPRMPSLPSFLSSIGRRLPNPFRPSRPSRPVGRPDPSSQTIFRQNLDNMRPDFRDEPTFTDYNEEMENIEYDYVSDNFSEQQDELSTLPSRPVVRPESPQASRPFRPSQPTSHEVMVPESVGQTINVVEPNTRQVFRDGKNFNDNNMHIEDNFNSNDYDSISPFDNDPVSEFHQQNFGDDVNFKSFLDQQFDHQFEFKKLFKTP